MPYYTGTPACDCKDGHHVDSCYQAKREEASRAAAAANQASGLPPLVGTPKQIAWAESIRQKVVAAGRIHASHTKEQYERIAVGIGADTEKAASCAQAVFEVGEEMQWRMRSETSAHWWIEHREESLARLVDKAMLSKFEEHMADEIAVILRKKAEAQAAEEAARQAQAEADRAARAAEEAAKARATASLATFVVASVIAERDDVYITSADGRLAWAYTDDWHGTFLYRLGDDSVDSDAPEAARVVADALAMLSANPAPVVS